LLLFFFIIFQPVLVLVLVPVLVQARHLLVLLAQVLLVPF
jgi:hypothetical protein